MNFKTFFTKNPVYLLLLIFLILLPLVLTPTLDILDQPDETNYHYITIQKFITEFPNFNLINDYIIPMTPLYHITMSLFGKAVSPDLYFLRIVNLVFSILCLLSLYLLLRIKGSNKKVIFFLLLFFLSPYFIGPSIRLSTDNFALLFIFLSIISFSKISSTNHFKDGIKSSLLIFLTIMVRQVHSWLLGVYFILTVIRDYFEKKSLKKVIINLLPMLIPVTAMIIFFLLWNGLMAPMAHHAKYARSSINVEAFIYIVSLIGLFNTFFLPWLLKIGDDNKLHSIKIYSMFAVASLLFLLIFPISNEYHESFDGLRGGSLWLIISKLPMIFNNSIVIWLLFPVGIIYLYILCRYFYLNKNYLELSIIFCWLFANILNPATYQKYYEPFILFFIGFVFISIKVERKIYWLGPVILLCFFILVDFFRFYYRSI